MTDSGVLLIVAFAALLGLAVGSFLNVVVWRTPRGESLVSPASACPGCGHAIRRRDNVPVLSWLVLRGRCRDCGMRISARYPLVEAATGVIFALIATRFVAADLPGAIPAFLYLGAISIALTLIDLDTHRLPNAIVLPAYPVSIALLSIGSFATGDWISLARAAAGAGAMFAFYLALALIRPRGMGFGDVKLSGVLGLYLGWLGWDALAVGTFAAFLLGGVFSIVLLVSRRVGRRSGIPFGPWMIGGAAVGVFFGERIASAYLSLVGLASS